MSKITFIIPSIGRKTLIGALRSLILQDNPNWYAIVIFDGVPANSYKDIIVHDKRITYLSSSNKIGRFNNAGAVRNIGIRHSQTEWCGFLDDDDSVVSNYVSLFCDIINKYKCVDVIQWRMKQRDGVCIPEADGEIKMNYIGISQSIKTSVLLEFPFVPSNCEDFDMLDNLNKQKKKIIISDKVTYLVRGAIESKYPNFTKRFYNFEDIDEK
jgi:glycosyltransferase involved in cell wall biosynthesis